MNRVCLPKITAWALVTLALSVGCTSQNDANKPAPPGPAPVGTTSSAEGVQQDLDKSVAELKRAEETAKTAVEEGKDKIETVLNAEPKVSATPEASTPATDTGAPAQALGANTSQTGAKPKALSTQELSARIELAQTLLVQQDDSLTEVQSWIEAARGSFDDAAAKLDQLKSDLAEKAKKIDELKAKLTRSAETFAASKRDAATLLAQTSNDVQEVARADARTAKERDAKLDLRSSELDARKADLSTQTSALDAQQKQLAELTKRLEEQSNELKHAQGDLETSKAENMAQLDQAIVEARKTATPAQAIASFDREVSPSFPYYVRLIGRTTPQLLSQLRASIRALDVSGQYSMSHLSSVALIVEKPAGGFFTGISKTVTSWYSKPTETNEAKPSIGPFEYVRDRGLLQIRKESIEGIKSQALAANVVAVFVPIERIRAKLSMEIVEQSERSLGIMELGSIDSQDNVNWTTTNIDRPATYIFLKDEGKSVCEELNSSCFQRLASLGLLDSKQSRYKFRESGTSERMATPREILSSELQLSVDTIAQTMQELSARNPTTNVTINGSTILGQNGKDKVIRNIRIHFVRYVVSPKSQEDDSAKAAEALLPPGNDVASAARLVENDQLLFSLPETAGDWLSIGGKSDVSELPQLYQSILVGLRSAPEQAKVTKP